MRGQKTTTIKDFARVSKNTDAPIGKNAPMRMTRSRSAAAATQLAAEVVQKPTVTRKRKLTDTDASVAPVNKKKLQRIDSAAAATPTRRKKPTTISAYFSPIKSVAETNEPAVAPVAESAAEIAVETVIEPLAESAIESAVDPVAESVVETVIETAVEPVVEPTQSNTRDKLNERAAVLLARLRDRKKVAAETTAAETTAEETRTIQGDLRTRRAAAAAAAAPLPTQAVSTFAEAGGVSAPEQHQRDVHRQFVAIASPHGRALPRELRKLSEIFQALDHAVMFAGHASVIYHRTRRAVESMAKRTFGWRELGQILALYPESYHHAPVPTTHEGRRVASLELTPRVGGLDLAVEIEARRDEFARRLVARVDAAHRAFLAQRGYDANDIDATRGHWHPAFDVESTPKVTPLPLPPTPAAAAGPVATFDRERLRHLLDAAEAKNVEPKEKPPAVLALPPTPADSPLLKPAALPKDVKVSPAKNLLERIREKQRAKEAAQLAAAQAIPPATRTMHSRLPAILETISFLFYTERRNVLPYFYVVDKLVESKGLERPDISNHIIALATFVPEWCSITEPGNKDSGATAEPNDTPPSPPVDPSPEARLNITRTISMRDAKARLIAKIEALNVE